MSRETADHEPDDYPDLEEWLRGSGLSTEGQQAVHDAVVESTIEGATPDRESVLRLIGLAAGRITIDDFTSQVLNAAVVSHIADDPGCLPGNPGAAR
ncbi:hypothetical protein ABQF35_03660 [Mycobacterium syngnathidarum]